MRLAISFFFVLASLSVTPSQACGERGHHHAHRHEYNRDEGNADWKDKWGRSLSQVYAPDSPSYDQYDQYVSFRQDGFCVADHFSNADLNKQAAEIRKFVNGQKNATRRRLCDRCIGIETVLHVLSDDEGSDGWITGAQIWSQMQKLNEAYDGTPFWFNLMNVTRTKNSSMFHLDGDLLLNDVPSMQSVLGDALRQGDRKTLNIYTLTMRTRGLGMAVFPSSFGGSKDGVFIDHCSVPNGAGCIDFNTGDIAVHETGHWLGLLHTFEGGCSEEHGDYVSDTPPQALPSYECPAPEQNSCPDSPGKDLLNNTMGYNMKCYDGFTEGQKARMYEQWTLYREGEGACKQNEGILTVEIGLDDNPESNFWRLFHANGQMISVADFGQSDEGFKQTFGICLPYGSPLYFGLGDSGEDGLARNATMGQKPAYSVSFDGKLLKNDTTFGAWAGAGFTMIDKAACKSYEMFVEVELLLDYNPEETHWRIENLNRSNVYVELEYRLFNSPLFYTGASIRREMCLLRQNEYFFVVEDSGMNGFNNTKHGDIPFFKISIDGEPVAYREKFSSKFEIQFDATGEVNGSTPSFVPSAVPTLVPTSRQDYYFPTMAPSISASTDPSFAPSAVPTLVPTSRQDYYFPTMAPSISASTDPSLSLSPTVTAGPSISLAPTIQGSSIVWSRP
jgi:hypothetical protein